VPHPTVLSLAWVSGPGNQGLVKAPGPSNGSLARALTWSIIFCSAWFYIKNTKSVKKTEPKPVQTDRFGFGYFRKKLVQTVRFGWLGFFRFSTVFSSFGLVWFFLFQNYKTEPSRMVFEKF